MLPPLSPSLKEKDGTKWMAALTGVLARDERVQALARISSLRPLTDAIAITDRRVIVFFSGSVGTKGPLIDISVAEISRSEIKSRGAGNTLVIVDGAGQSKNLGTLKPADVDFVIQQINSVARAEPPRAPTVDVYDPFTKPWAEPETANQSVDPTVAPPPRAEDFQLVSDEPQPMEKTSVADDMGNEPERLVPLRKTIPAWAFAGFCLLGVIASIFADGTQRLGVGLLYLTLLLIPLLALSRARRNAIRRRAESAGAEPRYGVVERNWFPVAIPMILVIFVLSIVVR